MHIFKAFALLLLTPLLLTAHPQAVRAQSANFQVTPTLTELDMAVGGRQTITINLNYPSAPGRQLDVVYYDFNPGEDGVPVLITDGLNEAYGTTQYLSGPGNVSIGSDGSATYQLNVTIPATAKEQTYFGVVSFKDSSTETATSVASVLLINVGEPNYSGEVDSFTVFNDRDIGLTSIDLTIANTGDFMFEPVIQFRVVDEDGALIESLEPQSTGNVLPNSVRKFQGLWSGNIDETKSYFAEAVVALPNGELITVDKTAIYEASPTEEDQQATATASSEDSDSSNNLLYGLLVGAGALVLLVAAVVVLKKRKGPKPEPSLQSQQPLQPDQNTNITQPGSSTAPTGPSQAANPNQSPSNENPTNPTQSPPPPQN